jgi:hypothetical protein
MAGCPQPPGARLVPVMIWETWRAVPSRRIFDLPMLAGAAIVTVVAVVIGGKARAHARLRRLKPAG